MTASFTEGEKEAARAFLTVHKEFLRKVNEISNARQLPALLGIASDTDLDCLAYVIYLIAQKKIPFHHQAELIGRKKHGRFENFMKKSTDYDHFVSLERPAKIEALRKLGFALKLALNRVFYKNTKPITEEDQGEQKALKLQIALADAVKKPH